MSNTTDDNNSSTDIGSRIVDLVTLSRIRRSYLLRFASALLVIVLIISLVGWYVQAGTASTLENDIEQQMVLEAEAEAAQLSEWIASNQMPARVLSDHPVYDESESDVKAYLDDQKANKLPERVSAVHVVHSGDEQIITSTNDERIGDDVSETDWVGMTSASGYDDVDVSNPYQNTNGNTVMAFLSPIHQQSQWWIVVTVDSEHISDEFDESIEGTFTEVVRPQAGSTQVLFSQREGAEMEPYIPDASQNDIPELSNGLDGNSGFTEEGTKNAYLDSDHLVSYAPVDGSDWVVIRHTPAANAYQLSTDVQQGLLAFIAIALIGVVVVGGTIGRRTAKSINQLSTKANAIEDGNYDVEIESDRSDEIGRLYRSFHSMRNSLKQQITETNQAKQEAEQARDKAQQLNRQLERKADEYSDVMQTAAAGDLTVRANVDSDNESMRTIGSEFNAMLEEMEATIGRLSQFAMEVSTASEEVTASSEEVRSASEQVAESVQEISKGANEQNAQLKSVNSEMESLSTTTEEIAASSNEVADIAEHTAETGRDGRTAAQDAIDEMEETETKADIAVDSMQALEKEVAHVDDLISQIQEIAEQTNMLALNANIEAARSVSKTEEGGFGAVAEEVKQLSAKSKEAAGEIESRLEEIREQTVESAEEVELTSERIDKASRQVEQAATALEEIAEYAQETNDGVQEISNATQKQATSTEEVVAMVDQAASISEETSSEAENVAAAAEEQTTSLSEVSGSASDLSLQATQLSEALERFDTDVSREKTKPNSKYQ